MFTEDMGQEETSQKLDISEVRKYIGVGGPLEHIFELFEERPTQIELLEHICLAFNEDKVGVFEAGTGVGKSFAYLIPAMLWAFNNRERVVISTGTINLQQQLYEKDIPLAKKILDKDVKAVLVKGRQNYICLRRFNDTKNEKDLFVEESNELKIISKWLATTQTGSNSDLSFLPNMGLWTKINSESDACMGQRCKYFEQCFVMKVRKEAADAHILIVNHHLLFADIEMRLGVGFDDTAVLPPYKRVVFDEAHGIEDAATSFFSESLTRFTFIKQLNRLYRKHKNSIAGHLYTLELLSNKGELASQAIQEIQEVKLALEKTEVLAMQVLDNSYTWRLTNDSAHQAAGLFSSITSLRSCIITLCATIRDLIDEIDEDDQATPVVWETKSILGRLDSIAKMCQNYSKWQTKEDLVFWLEKAGGGKREAYPRFVQTPLDIAPLMKIGVFEPLKTVVCVSATLTTAGSFNFWLNRSGIDLIDQERIVSGSFTSPFNYKENVIFSIPTDIPLPHESSFQQHIENTIVRLIRNSQGRALVLFTSYDSLRSACEFARHTLANDGINVIKQGDDDRFRLLQTFKEDISSVLFATDSFWEGVDVPGESLSQVILVKLPFAVPTDPVFAARSEAIEKRGGSSFMELSLPGAVITFRQGFGRLIRHTDDRGVVITLDKRLVTKQYGKLFINSIPQTKCIFDDEKVVSSSIEQFLNNA